MRPEENKFQKARPKLPFPLLARDSNVAARNVNPDRDGFARRRVLSAIGVCQHHSLPALASLVVEQATGLPAPGFAAVSRDEIPREQERVWAFDWYAIFPPTIEELVES